MYFRRLNSPSVIILSKGRSLLPFTQRYRTPVAPLPKFSPKLSSTGCLTCSAPDSANESNSKRGARQFTSDESIPEKCGPKILPESFAESSDISRRYSNEIGASGASPTLPPRSVELNTIKEHRNRLVFPEPDLKLNPQTGPLPPLPDRVTGYPTPHITAEDFLSYIKPLYSYRWGVTYAPKKPYHPHTVPQLVRLFEFKGFAQAIEFIQDVGQICKTEYHHPVLKVDGRYLFFQTFTHSGMRPPQFENETTKDLTQPGLTLRDIRLAILVEMLFREVYIPDGRGQDETSGIRPDHQRPL